MFRPLELPVSELVPWAFSPRTGSVVSANEGELLHPTRQRDRDAVRREIFGYGSLTLLFGPKDFDTWGRSEDLAEVVHPVPSVFG